MICLAGGRRRARVMNQLKPMPFRLLTLAAVALWAAGCATLDINPPQPRANTGYVDFHAESADDLNWEVVRFDDRTQSFRSLYSELEVPPGGILRLAFTPGHHRLRVTLLNRVVTIPATFDVEIEDGKITPVRFTMINAGTGAVETRDLNYGGTGKGRYGRRVRIGNTETVMYRLTAETAPPMTYLPKERMSYAQ